MTTTVKVTACCGEDTEVKFGITTAPVQTELHEIVTLQNGETAEKYVYDGRIAVVLERKKQDSPPTGVKPVDYARMDKIARVCHEVNKAYCEALGDHSQPTWEEAPVWQRESARMGVDLHLMGDFGPEASHQSWMAQKVADGWVYGPVKDPAKKEHPCMVPFAELPKDQQAKDFIFRAVVHALKGTI